MRALPLLTVVFLTSAPVFAVQSVVPTAFPASRYEKLKNESPFALATQEVAPEAPKDSFTKDWVLTALSNEPDAQGVERPFVSIMTRDQTQRIYLFGNEPNKTGVAAGVAIATVERSPVTGKSKVTLKKGNEFGTVEFDQMLIQSAPQGGNPGQPGMPQRMPGGGNPGLNPAKQPMGRPMIPRPNLPVPQANNGAAPFPGQVQPAQGGDARRRIRVINSKP